MPFPWQRRLKVDPLDEVLWRWTPHDPVTVRMLLDGGLAVLGRTGSGKTSSTGKLVGRAVVGQRNSGGLLLAAKPEDVAMWRGIFADAGRPDDLVVVEPDDVWRLNFLDYLTAQGADTRQITRCLGAIGESLRAGDGAGGEDAGFWREQQQRVIYNAVEALRLGLGRVTAPDLARFINTAPYAVEQIAGEAFQAGFCRQCLKRAMDAPKSPLQEHDFSLAAEFWLGEFPRMADKTRSSILAGVMGLLHTYNTSIVREMVSTVTNVSPEDMLKGKWVVVNLPPSHYGDAGRFVNAGWKFVTQWRLLRRQAAPGDPVVVIWADEAGQFVNEHDDFFISQCRSRYACLIFLAHSVHSYHAAMPGEAGRSRADALLAHFSTKVFHALGDVATAELASNLVGRRVRTFVGGSTSPPESLWDELAGNGQFAGSFSQHVEAVVQPAEFLNGLRTGGPSGVCDAIVVRSGEPFASGENWLKVAIRQS